MMNLYKILFFSSLIIGTIIAISSQTWLGMWIGLEINLLSIIPLMNNSKNLFSSEASLKYFITQALASSMLLFSILMNMSEENTVNSLASNPYFTMMMNSALLTKMGAAPFHFWFPEVIEGLNWNNCLILLTWQKIAPMMILMYNVFLLNFLSIVIIFCMVVSGIVGLNQVSLRKILAYSSINHMGWMIASMIFIETIWYYYFLIYAIISINIILVFKKLNIFYLKQIFPALNQNYALKLFFILNFFSLGGLPPFLGFLPKWMTIQVLASNGMIILPVCMVLMTLLTLFYYMRVTFSSLLLTMSELSFLTYQFSPLKMNFIFLMNFITLSSLIFCTMIFNWL
uniref:NADH dehydrogenase subunit 2 n=1 Tax=Julodis variolaris TaxID=3025997 RepID=UPI0023AB2105|nr:NADH dehydrogenase subunit 2 [Julodis variolaris]WCO87679.1 NADH dehydrogenase subunit 2 [Julodis variolaris]